MLKYIDYDNYKITTQIGKGSFGEIYKCIEKGTKNVYAVKLENKDAKYPQLANEYKIYRKMELEEHIPNVYYYGTEGDKNVLVMDLLGPSIEEHFKKRCRRLSVKTVLMLAIQMITCLETVHKYGYIHRDVKPDNFCLGTGSKQNTVYILDFGLAKKYVLPNGDLVPWKDGKSFAGTARYGSINALNGQQQSRRDDMESLAYVWIYLVKGVLPWQDIVESSRTLKHRKIAQSKKSHTIQSLCFGMPSQFQTYLETVRNYQFEEKPDYDYLRGLMTQGLASISAHYDLKWDWSPSSSSSIKLIESLSDESFSDALMPQPIKKQTKPVRKVEEPPVPAYRDYRNKVTVERKETHHHHHYSKPTPPPAIPRYGRVEIRGSNPYLMIQNKRQKYKDESSSYDYDYSNSKPKRSSHHHNSSSKQRLSRDYKPYQRKSDRKYSYSSSSTSSTVDKIKYKQNPQKIQNPPKPKVKSSVDEFLERRGIKIPERFLR